MDYGELIDGGYNPYEIYPHFVKYFKNPVMTKIKDQENYSMWACKIYGLLSKEHRYVIVFTDKDLHPVSSEQPLENLLWINLQTRTLNENLNCKVHSYIPSNDTPLRKTITKVAVTNATSSYSCADFPLSIVLFHTAKKDKNSYQNQGTVVAALETYETSISFQN
jgi:hypothetical protein